MSAKNSAAIGVDYPIFGLRFVNNTTLIACGGGGEGRHGIPNKITAIRCSFNVADKNRRLQKFREITLPINEDNPQCVDFVRGSSEQNAKYSIFIGCNQSTELIKSMNINNNLRKYVYTDDEHLRFSDAVQFDDTVSEESVGQYPKAISLAPNGEVGAMMTSQVPSEIHVFNPETLELKQRVKPATPTEIKDFHVNPHDGGMTLVYVTDSLIETVSTNSGNTIVSAANLDKKTAKIFSRYRFSRVRYLSATKVIITASLRNKKGSAVLEFDLDKKKVTKEKFVSSKSKVIVGIDVSTSKGLIAIAGNDISVSLIRISDFKVIKTHYNLHPFAITCLSFSPNGAKLATGSAGNTLHVLDLSRSSGGFMGFLTSLFKLVFFAVMIGVLSVFLHQANERGDLEQLVEFSKSYGTEALSVSHHYGKMGLALSQRYGAEYFNVAQKYGKIGYELAMEKGAIGMELVKSKLEKKAEQAHDSVEKLKEDALAASSTFHDIVHEVTKNVDDVTSAAAELDISSVIEDAIDYVSVVTEATSTQSTVAEPADSKEAQPDSDSVQDSSEDASSIESVLSAVPEEIAVTASTIAKATDKVAEAAVEKASEATEKVANKFKEDIAEPVIAVASSVSKIVKEKIESVTEVSGTHVNSESTPTSETPESESSASESSASESSASESSASESSASESSASESSASPDTISEEVGSSDTASSHAISIEAEASLASESVDVVSSTSQPSSVEDAQSETSANIESTVTEISVAYPEEAAHIEMPRIVPAEDMPEIVEVVEDVNKEETQVVEGVQSTETTPSEAPTTESAIVETDTLQESASIESTEMEAANPPADVSVPPVNTPEETSEEVPVAHDEL